MEPIFALTASATEYLRLASIKSDKTPASRLKLIKKINELIRITSHDHLAPQFLEKFKSAIQNFEENPNETTWETLTETSRKVIKLLSRLFEPSKTSATSEKASIAHFEIQTKAIASITLHIDPKTLTGLQALKNAYKFLALVNDPTILTNWCTAFQDWLNTTDTQFKPARIEAALHSFCKAISSSDADFIEEIQYDLMHAIENTLDEDYKYENDALFLNEFLKLITCVNGIWSVSKKDNLDAWTKLIGMINFLPYKYSSLHDSMETLRNALFKRQMAINYGKRGSANDDKTPFSDFVKLVVSIAEGILTKRDEFEKIKQEIVAADKKAKEELGRLKESLEPIEKDNPLVESILNLMTDHPIIFKKWVQDHPHMIFCHRTHCHPLKSSKFVQFGKEKGTNNFLLECRDEFSNGPHFIARFTESQMVEFFNYFALRMDKH